MLASLHNMTMEPEGSGNIHGESHVANVPESPIRSVNEVVSRVIKQRRARLDLSQTELARRMRSQGFNWHQATVNRTEAGERPLRLDEALAIAALLGLPMGDLYADLEAGNGGETAVRSEEVFSAVKKLEERYRRLSSSYESARVALDMAHSDAVLARARYEEAEIEYSNRVKAVGDREAELERVSEEIETLRESLVRARMTLTRMQADQDARRMVQGMSPEDVLDIAVSSVKGARIIDGPGNVAWFQLVGDKGVIFTSQDYSSREAAKTALDTIISTFSVEFEGSEGARGEMEG